MRQWSEKSIQDTLDFWGPKYLEQGEKLNREDAVEILNNMFDLLEVLAEIDKKKTSLP